MGTLIGIAVREGSRAPMREQSSAAVTLTDGLAGDWRGRLRDRQVTVLAREAWQQTCAELGADLGWATRRANLLVEGVDLRESAGGVLAIGEVRLAITGETRPCGRMDEAFEGLTRALTREWRGGVTCRVLSAGVLRLDDRVELIRADPGGLPSP